MEGETNIGQGFLGSITKEKVFYLKKNVPQAKLTQYNPYYIIFGNAQLRIKLNKEVVESNLGIVARYFDTGSIKNPEILLGSENNEAALDCYEVFQVIYQ